MRVAINAWFWNRPTTGSGQYTHNLVESVSAIAPNPEILLVVPSGYGFRVLQDIHSEALNPKRLFENSHSGPWRTQSTVFQTNSRSKTSNLVKVCFEQIVFPWACRHLEADVAHVPYWASPIVPSVPTIVTIHDLIPLLLHQYRGGPLVRLYTTLVSATAQKAKLVLTDSQASRRDILSHLGLPSERVRAIPLAADARYRPRPAPDDAMTRARYGLPNRYVLYLGGFDVRKNVATVLRTYRWAGPCIGAECPLVIAGRLPEQDTALTPDPRRLVQEQGVDERFVRFTGFVDEADKPALYRGAVAFIFPSHYEGFGLPPLEALACGTPVVGSDTSSIPEVVGTAGVLLPPDDAEGMADAIIQLAIDGNFRAEMSQRALQQATQFSWERTARETMTTYQETLGSYTLRV